MIELHVSDTDVTTGNIAISWCVDQGLLDFLASSEVNDPQLVICISPEDHSSTRKEVRKIVPLKDMMTYLEFRSSGRNKIGAFVCISDKNTTKSLFSQKCNGEFTTWFFDSSGENYASHFKNSDFSEGRLSEFIYVNVPEQSFAPEPSEWEKNWVNHLFNTKSPDQCDFRRRRLFAYTIQPILGIGSLLVRFTMLLVATLIGSKNWSLKYLLHPITYSLNDSWNVMCGGTIFLRDIPEDNIDLNKERLTLKHLFKKTWTLLFMPVIFLSIISIPIFYHCKLHDLFLLMVFIASILFLVIATIIFVAYFCSGSLSRKNEWLEKIRCFSLSSLFSFKESNVPWYKIPEEQRMIICDGIKNKKVTLDSLPNKKRTIWLRVADLKGKICRPFSE